ncbi:MAG: hypothetical protein HUU37_07830 [Bdellovibrionales bacterium]|nr:hypothetical protein [Bdellovibrionales bacterium]
MLENNAPPDQVIPFPKQATVAYMDGFLQAVRRVRLLENSPIIFDLRATTEISPVFVCFICALRDLAQERGNSVSLYMPRNKRVASTVRAIKPLFRTVGRPSLRIADRMLQVRKITGNNPQPIEEILELLGDRSGLPIKPELRFNILLVMTELLTNAIDHSGERALYVCAGAWGKSRNLHITALDFGVGIPQKIRTRYLEYADDADAVRALLQTGGLTTRTDRAGGRGYKTIREVLQANRGRLFLFTGRAKAILRYDRYEHLFRRARKEFGGTCVDLQFNLDGGALYSNMTGSTHEDIF